MMQPYVDAAREHERGSFLPGWSAAFAQLEITAGLAFCLGLISIIRRERLSWVGAIPCLLGGLVLLPFAFGVFRKIGGAAVDAMLPSAYLVVGILMGLNGVFFLAWVSPRASARLAREEQADGVGAKNARMTMEEVKLFGTATLIVGVVFILIHAFGLSRSLPNSVW